MNLFGFLKKEKKEENCCSKPAVEKETTSCCSNNQESSSCCSTNEEVKEEMAMCECGNMCPVSEIEAKKAKNSILVLGACCKKSSDSFANVKAAVKELGLDVEVINIGDNIEIAQYGVMNTPALVVNNKVLIAGSLIKIEKAKELISANI